MDRTDVSSAPGSSLQSPSSPLSTKEVLRSDSCRSCLSQAISGTTSMWKLQDQVNDQNLTFMQLYKLLTDIEVSVGDNLPQSLCSKCAEELIRFHSFRNRCIESETRLHGLVFETADASYEDDNVPEQEADSLQPKHMEQESKFGLVNKDIVHIEDTQIKQEVDCTLADSDNFSEATNEIKEECDKNQVVANSHPAEIKDVASGTNQQTGTVILPNPPKINGIVSNFIFPTITLLTVPLVTRNVINAPPSQQETVKADIPKCDICGKTFQFPSRLRDHMPKHTNEKPHACSVCHQRFNSRSNIHRHMKTHTGEKPYVCDACGKAFVQKNALAEHRRIHTGEKPILCTHCGRSFRHHTALIEHMKRHSLDRNGSHVKYLRCQYCGRFFKTKLALEHHKRKLHVNKEGVPLKPKLLCSECGKSFASASGLRYHLAVHKGERPHRCDYCGKTFMSKELLKRHTLCHTGEKPYVCKVCSRGFSQSAHLKYHVRSHTGVKAFSCDKCQKAFASKTTLAVHVRTHTREAPFVCSLCPKRFHHEKSRKKHEQRHEAKVAVAQETL